MVNFSDKIDLRRRNWIISGEMDLQIELTFSVRGIIWAFYGCYPLQAFFINGWLFYTEVGLLINHTKFFFDAIKCKNSVRPLSLRLFKLLLIMFIRINRRVFFLQNLKISLLFQFRQFNSIKVGILQSLAIRTYFFHTGFTAVLFVTKGCLHTCSILANLKLNIFNCSFEFTFLLLHQILLDLLLIVKTAIELLYLKLKFAF